MFPERIGSTDELDDLLSAPSPDVIETLRKLDGDILILGVGGKMGPTLAQMAARASREAGVRRRIIGVARFSNPQLPAWLQKQGVEPLVCDLLDPKQLENLPNAANIVAMPAFKFGSSSCPANTWA